VAWPPRPLIPANQEHSRNRSSLAHAGGDDIRFNELHGVIDRESRGNRATRGINVQLNVLFRILGLQKEHLSGSEVRDMVVDRSADKDDVFLQQARIDVVRTLAPAGLFHDHRNQSCRAVDWIFVVFHG
jgi:hypothetical protein